MKNQSKTPKHTERPPKPFGYAVEGGMVSRIVRINPAVSDLPNFTRQVFTPTQLADMWGASQ